MERIPEAIAWRLECAKRAGVPVEEAAERAMDRLDRAYLAGRMDTAAYDAACAALDAWVRA